MSAKESGCYVRDCELRATHTWKRLNLCCEHFDWLVGVMYEMNEAVANRRYDDMLEIYRQSASRMEKFFGIKCPKV